MSVGKKRDLPVPRVGPPAIDEVPRFKPVWVPAPPEELEKNFQKYVDIAQDMGASDVMVVSPKDIPLDIRAAYMCHFPHCRWLNSNDNCPMVRTFPFDEAQEIVRHYAYALAYRMPPPADDEVPDVGSINLDMYYTMAKGAAPDPKLMARNVFRQRIVAETARRIEQAAYYDGCYLKMSAGVGPCLVTWCAAEGRCVAMKEGFCKFCGITQPVGSSALYIDYYGLARMLGWGEMQPGGNCAFPEDTPEGFDYFNIGLTFLF